MSPKLTGAYIARLRKDRGLKQSKFAEQLNVTDKAVSRGETGNTKDKETPTKHP